MPPSFPSAPPWYRYVLIGRWLFLKGIVAAGRAPVEPFAGAAKSR